ncbi:MAG: serine hydrolase [Ignavibacteria bacterium]|nr:serine hydrolase [Ignavibacteria bacterium]
MKILLIIISLITLPNVIYSLNTFDSLFIKDNGITSEVHKNNTGKITFMESIIPVESFTESDFLSSIELLNVKDLNIRVYLKNSLTNELHKLAPELSADELNAKGNYRFEFYVDDNLMYSEDLNPGAGSGESKKVNTVFRVPLISSTGEDSWGRFLWQRFMFKGGEDALTEGTHKLKIIIKPYFKNGSVIYGDVIASGEILLNIKYPEISEAESRIQLISSNSGWETAGDVVDTAIIRDLNTKILQNYFKEITGIAVIKSGELVLEEYFNGYNRDSLHDTRSVGKSFASALTGIAINDGFIKSENETLNKFYDLKKYDNFSLDKEKVTLKSLLTMSSGFYGSDLDMSSPGNEENMYPAADWVKFALDLPMDSLKTIGKSWDYFTAGVVLLGDILNKSVPNGLEKYSAEKLFQPLEISRYQWEYTPQGVANTAGGLRLRLLDLAKFGWLYNNKGKYKNKQILPEEWVNKSLTRHLQIPGSENEFYGYLFWNMIFNVNGISYEAYYASGNGGNKIFIFKELPLVIVITSTAYNKPYSHRQVNIILEKYLLPAVVK